MVKRENLAIFRTRSARMTLSSGGFLETDLVLPENYPNVGVWKDLRHGSALGDKILMKGMLPRSNGELRMPSTARHLDDLSLSCHTNPKIYIRGLYKVGKILYDPFSLVVFFVIPKPDCI